MSQARHGSRLLRACDGSPRKGTVLALMSLGLFLVQLDATIVNVSLPDIANTFHSGMADIQWIVNAYTIPFAALILAGGTLGGRFGHRTLFTAGLAIFTVGSLIAAIAPDHRVLIAARVIQGVGGAAVVPASLAILTHTYTDERQRAGAIGLWAAIGGMALPLGPLTGGLLVQEVGWRWIFLTSALMGVAGLALAAAAPAHRDKHVAPLDFPGILTAAVTLTAANITLIEGGAAGWTSPLTMVCAAGTLAGALAFGYAERRSQSPLLPAELMRNRSFVAANITAVFAYLISLGAIFISTLYLQEIQHRDPLVAGAALVPLFVTFIVFAAISGRLTARLGARKPAAAGLVLGGAGMALMIMLEADTPYAVLLPILLLLGLGIGLFSVPIVNTAVGAVSPARTGLASGFNGTCRQAGGSLGVALFGALTGDPTHADTFVHGLHLVGLLGTLLFFLSATIAITGFPGATGAIADDGGEPP